MNMWDTHCLPLAHKTWMVNVLFLRTLVTRTKYLLNDDTILL